MRQQPRKRQLQNRVAVRFGVLDQHFHLVEILVGQKFPVALVLRDPRVLGNRLALSILPREQPALEREERKERQALSLAFGEHAFFRLPMKKAVLVLNAHEPRWTRATGGLGLRLTYLLCRKVRAADLPHLAGSYERVERAQRLLDWDIGVWDVLLIQIDVIRAEPLEARLESLLHVFGARPPTLSGHVVAELGGNDHVGAMPFSDKEPADQFLAPAVSVHVGGIEEVDPRVQRRVDDILGARLVDAHAEIVAAQAHDRDFERADLSLFHSRLLYT